MKLFLLVVFLGIFPFLNAADPNIDAAIAVYSKEIDDLEHSCLDKRLLPGFYNERANLYFAQKSFETALEDYQKALICIERYGLDDPSNLLKSHCGVLFCYKCLEDDRASENQYSPARHPYE